MSASNAFENSILKLIYQNIAFAGIGDAGGLLASAAPGNLYVGLHTADPGETGDQTTNEATYTGYARKAVVRSAVGWTVTNDTVDNAAAVTFDPCTAGTNTITHFSVGTSLSGAGILLFSGALTAPLAVSSGITPQFVLGVLDNVCT